MGLVQAPQGAERPKPPHLRRPMHAPSPRSTDLLIRPLRALGLALVAAAPAAAQDLGDTERVSVADGGLEVAGLNTGNYRQTAVSADGRFVVFSSRAPDLVPGDTNGAEDVFLRDRIADTTVRVSVGAGGVQADGPSDECDVSDDGRFVVFASVASNLVPGDGNGLTDVFLRDVVAGTTTLVSRTPGGATGVNGGSELPSISGDGARVAFESNATGLDPADTNGTGDVFLYERATDTVRLVSRAPGGAAGNGSSSRAHISADGGWVAFSSAARNLGPSDPTGTVDIYVHDVATGNNLRITGPTGSLDSLCQNPRISRDGRHVAFQTGASNLLTTPYVNGAHIARWDRISGEIEVVSRDLTGAVTGGTSGDPDISDDGVWVAFRSFESDLVAGDSNGREDVFVRNVPQRWTERASVAHDGGELDAASRATAISGNGRFTLFSTTSTLAVPSDNNSGNDVFVRDRGFTTGFAGAEYCASTVNSSGSAARTVAAGDPTLSASSLTLATVGVPPNTLGFYFMSRTAGFVPGFGGSQGNLCVGGTLFRLDQFVVSADAQGRTSSPLPFAQLPPGAAFAVGERWNFQLWFRDVVGGTQTSNTSSAVGVIWR